MSKKYTRKEFLRTVGLSSIVLLPGCSFFRDCVGHKPETLCEHGTDENVVNYAFRLLQYKTLLNLELYFINVRQCDNRLWPLLSADNDGSNYVKSYMVVRLPQQHIAEQYRSSTDLKGGLPDGSIFHTAISGYSYLCFQINFEKIQGLPIDADTFLDWNAEYYDLITRDLSEKPLFELETFKPNNYPLGYNNETQKPRFDPVYFPNVSPKNNQSSRGRNKNKPFVVKPVTAIEAPYRLLISPFRPSVDYKFMWVFSFFSRNETSNVHEYELWTATLHMQKTFTDVKREIVVINDMEEVHTNSAKEEVETPVQLMILGTPDIIFHKEKNTNGVEEFVYENDIRQKILVGTSLTPEPDPLKPNNSILDQSLPDPLDRININRLGKLEVTAYTPDMMFTPLGISANMNLINPNPEKNHIDLVKWHHWISFGRDQQVEVAELVMEATFGLKMLYVRTTRRETVSGNSLLVYREFLMPYERSKDYDNYDSNAQNVYKDANYKFNTPTSKISFREKGAKQILPLYLMNDHILYDDKTKLKRPLAYRPVTPARKFLEWEFDVVTHGQEQPVHVTKKLCIVTTRLSNDYKLLPDELQKVTSTATNNSLTQLNTNADAAVKEINDEWQGLVKKSDDIWIKVLHFTEDFELNKLDVYRKKLEHVIPDIEDWIKDHALTEKKDFLDQAIEAWGSFKRSVFDVEKGLMEYVELLHETVDNEIVNAKERIRTNANFIIEGINKRIGSLNEEIVEIKKKSLDADTFYKEKLAQKIKGIEAEISRLKVFINDNPSQKITQAITDFEASVNTEINNLGKTISSLKKNVEDAVQTSANNAIEKIKAGYNDLIANADALLNKLQRDKSFKTQVAGQQIFTSYNSTVSRIDEIIGKIKKITDTKLLSFDIYKKQFLDKLPSNFVNEFLDKKGNELKLLKNILREIDHIEDNLKSKVECAKAEIGYAANVIEDELKNVRTFLEKKYGGFTEEAKKRYEEIKAAYTAEINGRISTMKTDFLIFRNNFRQNVKEVEKRAFDFYHEHACFPQLHTAQVYISAVKDMVNKDVPLKIKYAEDYIKNQVDSRILETQKNASRVFAEIKSDARQHLQSAIRSAAHDLGGIVSPQLGDKYLTFLKDKTNDFKELGQRVGNEFTSQINNEVKYANKVLYEFNKELSNAKQEVLGQYNHLVALTEEVKNSARAGADEIKAKGEEFFKSLEAKIVGSIHLKDLLKGIDFKIPKLERKGNMLTYQFITKEGQIKDVPTPGNQFKFIAEADASKTLLSIYLEKSIKNVGEYRSVTQLKNFTIGVFSERLLVKVDKLELLNTNSVKNKCSFALRKIVFQKELEFFAKLAEGVKIPGTGLILHVTPKEIGVDFTFAIPTIASGAFTLDNLKFVFGVVIPLPVGPAASHQPMVTKIGINGPNDKFTVAVLIFGGKGHFVLETTPRYIRLIDTEIDFGGNLQLSLFIASGKAYLMAGIRYVYERNEEGETTTKLYAILTAGACLTVFGFINISVVFSLYLTYIDSGGHASLYGTCTISCSVSIGFFSKSFDLTMEKRISGTGDPHGSTYVPPRRPSYMLQDDSGIWTEQQSDPDEKYMVKRPDLITHMTNEAWMELLEAYNF